MTTRKSLKTISKKASPSPQKILNNQTIKFTLYDYQGKIKAYYLVEKKPFQYQSENLGKPPIAHSIIIVDRSGSMYGDIEQLKEYLIKLLTLDEYLNSQLVITLISYSSLGDVKCHFQRIPITEIMKTNSEYQQEIKQMQVTGLTCISQSLQIAKTLIEEFTENQKQGELTAITLHTDGFANDPNYTSEVKNIEKLADELNKNNVIINTISYSNYADFKLLSKLANLGSGHCLQAKNVKEVYDSLYKTTNLLNGQVCPPIEEPLIKGYDYQVFASLTAKKIIGSNNTLNIRGVTPEDEGVFYKYRQVTAEEYDNLTDISTVQTDESVFAFIKANLAEGNINLAKYALVSTFDDTLTQKHCKALTNQEIINFTQDIEAVIFNPQLLKNHEILSAVKVNDKISILELIDIFEEHKNHIIINLKHLQKNYQRKGVKRIQGKRDEEGNLIKPTLKTVEIDGGKYVSMGEFNINRNTATINMLIERKVKLVHQESNKQIYEVAGILLNDLKEYNNYTLISDGEINIKSFKVKINSEKTFNLLKEKGVLTLNGNIPDVFDFVNEYDLNLADFPLLSFSKNYDNLNGIFEEIIKQQILLSIISAHIKDESATYSEAQLTELRRHYLSKNLYLNFPTTNEYTDLKEALNNGSIDTRISYKIDLGNKYILNMNKLYSANKFLERLYEAYEVETGDKLEKVTFDMTLTKNLFFSHKTLSNRTKITPLDELMKTIFDDFLAIENNGIVSEILTSVKADKLSRLLQEKRDDKEINKQELVKTLTEAQKLINNSIESIYHQQISPLVFYIGATGLMPDELSAKALSAEEIAGNYPELKISKNEQEGTFFLLGDTIISVYPQTKYFTTNHN